MACRVNFYSIVYSTFFMWIVTLCSGFVLISSATAQNDNLKLFIPGERLVYKWKSSLFLNEIEKSSKNVGFLLDGKIIVSSIWGHDHKRLLKIELNSVKLHVRSSKAHSPDGFIPHSSNLDTVQNAVFLVTWDKGLIKKIILPKDDSISIKNLKKGIASLWQLQLHDGEASETDASGTCTISYNALSPSKIVKTKSKCTSPNSPKREHLDPIIGAKRESTRILEYIFDTDGTLVKQISSKESHHTRIVAKEELGGTIDTDQHITFIEKTSSKSVAANSMEEAIQQISKELNVPFSEESLLTEKDPSAEESSKNFNKQIGHLRDSLKTEHFGTIKAAKAFLQLVQSARASSTEDISKALESKKNVDIMTQIYDILGYAQTENSHKAAMKKLHLDSEEQTDNVERYLWALSFSVHPNVDILNDLLEKYIKYTNIPVKIKDTLILTLASMARKLSHLEDVDYELTKVSKSVQETIINGLDYAKATARSVFFNALKNLRSPSTISHLIRFIKNGTMKEEVLAWRALKSFGKDFWTEEVLKMAKKTLYQLDKKHDTSARATAADIISTKATDEDLSDLLHFVASNETNFEIKQYVFQNLKMLSDRDDNFNQRVQQIIKKNKELNNYSSLSPRGLSTALTRSIYKSSSSNGSLVSIQEIKSGIVKQGVVNVVLDKNGLSNELFTLGIFSGGLSSLVSSDNSEEDQSAEDTATAGMELTVLGTQIRPFVFFDGQGELMGHVWSGTASEMTPAFQALILLQDHEDLLRLGNGFIAELSLKGAVSFDLSGKIEISLWNRNSEALVEKTAGIVTNGLIKVDTSFVQSKVEFEGSIEPKISLNIDADFSSNVNLCIRLSQLDSIFRHSISKFEKIPGSQHQLKITKNKKSSVPGVTYALNRKNNEMCTSIFS